MIQSKNIIKKLTVEVNTNSVTKAMQLKDTIDTFIKEEIYPEIEALLKKYSVEIGSNSIQIDTLQIEVKGTNYSDFKASIVNKLEKSIKSTVQNTENTQKNSISIEDKSIKALLFFLETGQLPWWYSTEEFFKIEDVINIKNKPIYHKKIVDLLSQKQVLQRVIYQFSFDQIEALILAVFNVKLVYKGSVNQKLKNKSSNNPTSNFWTGVFSTILNNERSNINNLSSIIKTSKFD